MVLERCLHRYICSRIYLHDPPGDDNALQPHPDAPAAVKEHEEKLANEDPEVNQWLCIAVIIVAVALMAVTAEFVWPFLTSAPT